MIFTVAWPMRGSHTSKIHESMKKINIGIDLENPMKHPPVHLSTQKYRLQNIGLIVRGTFKVHHEKDDEICLCINQSPNNAFEFISTNISTLKHCHITVRIIEETVAVFSDK